MKGWMIALLGGVLYVATSGFLIIRTLNALPELGNSPVVEKEALPPRIWSFQTEAVDQLIAELKTGREKLEADQKSVVVLKTQIDAEKAELEKSRGELQRMRDEIDQRVLEIQDSEMANLKTLAKTYSTMAPPAAVAILREMDENMVVKILALMKVDKVGPVLGEMGRMPEKKGEESMAKRAARISDKLRLIKPIKKETAAS